MTFFKSLNCGQFGFKKSYFNYQKDSEHWAIGLRLLDVVVFSAYSGIAEGQWSAWFRVFGIGLSIRSNYLNESYRDLYEYEIPIRGYVIGFIPKRPIKARKYAH